MPTTVAAAPTTADAGADGGAATCMHHATIDEGTARCGAGESHPSGAGAQCHDGSYSYSKTPEGTCSHHKGVAIWYY